MQSDTSGQLNEQNQSAEQNQQRFESDTKKVMRRHLSDKDHVITEEEIASIRVGMTPPSDDV